jgi:hypothetical protein
MDKYGAYLIDKLKASGASDAGLQTQIQQVKQYKELYENPLYNAAITFIEPFPIGLIITLLSAAFLRKNKEAQPRVSVGVPLPD